MVKRVRKTKSAKRTSRVKKKRVKTTSFLKDVSPLTLLLVGIVAAAVIYIYLSSSLLGRGRGLEQTTTTTVSTLPIYPRGECGDLSLTVDTIIEASNYYGSDGFLRTATEENKFVILKITATNDADTHQDFSGYRMELTASGQTYAPRTFNNVEQVTLMAGATSDYVCDELTLAHTMSRFELNPHQTVTGCKMFNVVRDAQPVSISIYDLNGFLCMITI